MGNGSALAHSHIGRPLRKPTVPTSLPPNPRPPRIPVHVLVIDDRVADLRLTCAALKEAQIEFETTGTTAGALRIMTRSKGPLIDAVLLETTLAGGSPFGSLREL